MLNRQNIQDIYQLSPIQEGIYFHALMDAQTQAYFSQTVYQLNGQFEPELMRQSLGLLVQRHDVLRTVFNHKKADELLQIVLKNREADFQYIDIRNLSEESQALYVDNFKEEDRRRNFNLNKDVLLRVSLLQLGEESYEFIWSIHHIIMDGWCQSVLIEEFQQIYMALKQGRAVDLPPTSQYRQYIDWLARQAKAPAIQFWQEYLEGYEGKRSLFSSPVDAYDNCEFEEMLPKELSSQLWQLAREQGLTLSSLLQTVWGITLGKYNGQQDAVLGMVGANRPAEIPYIERAVGVFINTLPIRVHYEPTEAFLEVARRVQSDQIRMQAFGFLPLTRIQQESVLKKALVNHAFIFENLPQVGESEEEGGEQAEAKTAGSFNQTNYHFNLIVEPNAQINFKFNYNGAALSEDFVRGLAGHFLHLLQQIPKKCNDPIQQLLLIKEDESQRLLAFNGKQVAPKEPLTILDAFEKQLSKDPDAIALVGPEQRLSYRDLNERAEQMAGGLLARMSSQNDPVIAIFMDRSIESVAAMLAIWKAGATYLPLHTEWPSARLKYILKDTGAEMVLCGTERETIEDIDIPQVRITDCNGPYNQQIATRPTPTDTAYIIYTSGTSGRPKGVPIRQESIVHQINYHNDYLNMQAGDRFLHMASLSFDASLVEMLMPLFSGGSIVLAPQSIKENTAKMMDYLQAQQVDTAIFPPAYLSLIDQLEQSSLRRIISTGEAIRMEEAVRLCDEIELYNGYGPTECCIGVSFHRVEAARKEQYLEAGAIPIGQPFEGAAVYILNPERQLLPQGQIGEICVAGIGLSKGYLNRPEETDKKFVSNPFARHQGEERLYRTGDLGCWNERGEMEFHGRIDDQVQLSGIRVEPKEIEGSLQQIEGVQNAIVQQLSKEGNLLLTAFVEAAADLTEPQLKEQLHKLLPSYMIPRQIVLVERFPLTLNGKVDRKKLEQIATQVKTVQAQKPTQTNEQERLLIELLGDILKNRHLQADSDFFYLGGDSIKAIQLVSRLYRKGYALEVKDVFNHPVLRQMAQQLRRLETVAEQGIVTGTYPLTPIQQEFFRMELQQPQRFNHAVLFEAKQALDASSIRQLLAKLLEQHDALRTSFVKDQAGTYSARIENATIGVRLSEFDLRTEADPQSRRRELCELLQGSFQLDKAPLMNAALFKAQDGDRLFICIHHLAFDGISWRILQEDIYSLYEQLIQGRPLELPPKTDSYLHWAKALQQKANGESFQSTAEFWKQISQREGGKVPQEETGQSGVDNCHFELDKALTKDLLTEAGKAYRTESNHLLLTALARSVGKNWGVDELKIMLEGHGREESLADLNISRTIGWFTALYPICLQQIGTDDIGGGLLKTVKAQLNDMPHKGVGYGLYKYLSQQAAGPAASSEPNLLFNFMGQFDREAEQEGQLVQVDEDLGNSIHPDEKPPFALSVTALVFDGQLQVDVKYDKARFSKERIEAFGQLYQTEIASLVTHCIKAADENKPAMDQLTYQKLSEQQLEQIYQHCRTLGSNIQDIYPLSPMQEGMFFQSLLAKKTTTYFYQLHYRLEGIPNLELLEESLNLLIARHDILRTIFLDKAADDNLQVVLSKVKTRIACQDIRSLEADKRELAIEEWLAKDKTQLFALNQSPLLRVSVILETDNRFTLVWSSHHILMDAWCFEVLVEEFKHMYRSLETKQRIQLPPVHQYKEYIDWLGRQDETAAEQYWQEYLAGYDTLASLSKRTKKSSKTYELQLSDWTVREEDAQAIRKTCQQWHITPGVFFQTVWGLLLARHSYREDVVFGKTVSGRPPEIEGIETMTGLFVNTIPVRIRYDQAQTFEELATQQQQEYLSHQQYQYCAFTRIQASSELKQSLLDHSFVIQNVALSDSLDLQRGEEWTVQEMAATEHTDFDLVVVVYIREGQMEVSLEYNALVFDEDYMRQLTRHYESMIRQLAQQPNLPLSQLSLITREERALIAAANQTAIDEKAGSVLDLLQAQIDSQPNAIAIASGREQLTYRELDQQSNQLAHYLIDARATGPGDVVALRIGRSVQATALLLGVLKTGASYLVIDRSFPRERVRFVLEDSKASLLLYDEGGLDQAPCPVVALSNSLLAAYETTAIDRPIDPATAMYTIYTSGSTGRPKGVQVSHAALHNYLCHNIEAYGIGANDKSILLSSMAYDLCYTSLWATLAAGGQQVVLPENDFLDVGELLDCLETEQVSILKLTPTTFHLLVHHPEFTSRAASLHIRLVLLGGEKIRLDDLRRYRRHCPQPVRFIDEYGPTETTVGVTQFDCEPDYLDWCETHQLQGTKVGRPIRQAQIHLLDAHQQEAGIGVIGELCISGRGLALGYLHRPELTAEKFTSHPQQTDLRIYRSGDLARWLPDGELEYLGRKDQQVKVKGYRVELGEIEAAIRRLEGVKDVVATAIQSDEQTDIAAYLILKEGTEAADLRAQLEEAVPAYMIPHFLLPMDAFPQLANGKTNRKALPKPEALLPQKEAVSDVELTEKEAQLIRVFEKVMKCGALGPQDNFFQLGGDSIRAMQIIALLFQEGYQLEIKDVFSHPLLSDMAEQLQPVGALPEEEDMDFSFDDDDDFGNIESDEMDLINQLINN